MKNKKIGKTLLFSLLCYLLSVNCSLIFAENSFGLRVMPQMLIPQNEENFDSGFGGSGYLDWNLSLPKRMAFGLSAGGAYSSVPVADGSSMSVVEAAFGPFFSWRFIDRLSVRTDVNAGFHNFSVAGQSETRFRFGADLSLTFHILPWLGVYAEGGYRYMDFAVKPIHAMNAGVGLSFNLSELISPPQRVTGEITEQKNVFPVNYAWYENNEVAVMRITNNEPNVIRDVSVSFFLERYMNEPSVTATTIDRLAPGESADINVTALFNVSMLDLRDTITTNSLIFIDYRSLGSHKQSELMVQMPVFSRNSMTWDDDRRAASFVSSRDPAAVYFSKYVQSAIRGSIAQDIPINVQLAAAIYDTLQPYGIAYIRDPATSYVELSSNAAALDTLNFPYQTLLFRGGECDDLAILYCALLEVLEIETAFITIPGHIFSAFDIGVTSGAWLNKYRNTLIEYDGKFWMPIENTVPQQGFISAWNLGTRQWRGAGGAEETGGGRAGERVIYPMHTSWELYQPVSVPEATNNMPVMPTPAVVLNRFTAVQGRLR